MSRFVWVKLLCALLLATFAAASIGCSTASHPDHETIGKGAHALTTCVDLGATGDALVSNPPMNQSFGALPILRAGGKDASLIRFDLGSIPSSAAISSATLTLYVSATSGGAPVNIHRVTTAWNEGAVTYASFAQQFDATISGAIATTSPNVLKSVDLTPLVTSWVSGAQSNFGVYLEASSNEKTIFVSREGGIAQQRPSLHVCYLTADDHCSPNPCQNGATCENGPSSYTCRCTPGFTGARCETRMDSCAENPCKNGSSCTNGTDGYACTCPVGYTGINCEIDINECAASPCQNGGVCQDGIGTFTCACLPGFAGTTCEVQIDNCAAQPCQNGAQCTNGTNSYACTCAAGYTGTNCEINVDDCAMSPCHNGGTCIDGVNAYSCSCPPDWGGSACDANLNTCAQHPCLNGSTCINGVGSYTCSCAPGFTGANCEIDINDCATNPCQNGGVCVDGVNSFTCTCPRGYAGSLCNEVVEIACQDPQATTSTSCATGVCSGGTCCTADLTVGTAFSLVIPAGATSSTTTFCVAADTRMMVQVASSTTMPVTARITAPDGHVVDTSFPDRTVSVRVDPAYATGVYALTVTRNLNPIATPTTVTLLPMLPPVSAALTVGGPAASLDLAPADRGELTFNAIAGRRIGLHVSKTAFGDFDFDLLSPSGIPVFSRTLGTPPVSGATFGPFPLTESGLYRVRYRRPWGGEAATITTNVEYVPDDLLANLVADGPPVTLVQTSDFQTLKFALPVQAGHELQVTVQSPSNFMTLNGVTDYYLPSPYTRDVMPAIDGVSIWTVNVAAGAAVTVSARSPSFAAAATLGVATPIPAGGASKLTIIDGGWYDAIFANLTPAYGYFFVVPLPSSERNAGSASFFGLAAAPVSVPVFAPIPGLFSLASLNGAASVTVVQRAPTVGEPVVTAGLDQGPATATIPAATGTVRFVMPVTAGQEAAVRVTSGSGQFAVNGGTLQFGYGIDFVPYQTGNSAWLVSAAAGSTITFDARSPTDVSVTPDGGDVFVPAGKAARLLAPTAGWYDAKVSRSTTCTVTSVAAVPTVFGGSALPSASGCQPSPTLSFYVAVPGSFQIVTVGDSTVGVTKR